MIDNEVQRVASVRTVRKRASGRASINVKALLLAVIPLALLGTACAGVSNPEGWAGPVLDGDTLYASIESGKMAALDPDDLSVRWVFPPDTKDGDRYDLEGIYGAPVIDGDTIYFGAHDGYVYALDTEGGALVWTFETGDPIVGGVRLAEGLVYAGSTDGRFYVIDAESGAESARFDTKSSIWAAPLVTETTVYISTMNGHLYNLDLQDLDPIWDKRLSSSGLLVDPVSAAETVLLAGGISEKLFAVDPNSGEQRGRSRAATGSGGGPLWMTIRFSRRIWTAVSTQSTSTRVRKNGGSRRKQRSARARFSQVTSCSSSIRTAGCMALSPLAER